MINTEPVLLSEGEADLHWPMPLLCQWHARPLKMPQLYAPFPFTMSLILFQGNVSLVLFLFKNPISWRKSLCSNVCMIDVCSYRLLQIYHTLSFNFELKHNCLKPHLHKSKNIRIQKVFEYNDKYESGTKTFWICDESGYFCSLVNKVWVV